MQMMGSNGILMIKYICMSKSCLIHRSSHIHNFSYVWHTGLKLHKQDKSCIYYASKYCIFVCCHSENIDNCYTLLFFKDTHYKAAVGLTNWLQPLCEHSDRTYGTNLEPAAGDWDQFWLLCLIMSIQVHTKRCPSISRMDIWCHFWLNTYFKWEGKKCV